MLCRYEGHVGNTGHAGQACIPGFSGYASQVGPSGHAGQSCHSCQPVILVI